MQGWKNLWLALVIISCVSCTDDEEFPPPLPIECPVGTKLVGNAPPTGNRQFCMNEETELEQGPWRFYFPNGRIQREGNYHGGRKHGRFTKWNHSGIKTSEDFYDQDKKTGLWREWTRDGNIRAETPYSENEIHGYRYFFYKNGNKSAEFSYIRGMVVSRKTFPEPGEPKTENDSPFVEDPQKNQK